MAYANYLASVEWSAIERLRNGSEPTISPHSIAAVSHVWAYWVKEQPLGTCLAEVIDRGEVLDATRFWHPFRVPVVHSPEASWLTDDEPPGGSTRS